MSEGLSCVWCERQFQPRRSGGRPQRFCRPSCRRAFRAAARAWALDAIATGGMTVADLKNGLAATRALLLGTIALAPSSLLPNRISTRTTKASEPDLCGVRPDRARQLGAGGWLKSRGERRASCASGQGRPARSFPRNPRQNLRRKKSARKFCGKSRQSRQAHPSEVASIPEAGTQRSRSMRCEFRANP
jgi:hypothetical protein